MAADVGADLDTAARMMGANAAAGAEIIRAPACNLASENTALIAREISVMAYQDSVYAAMGARCGREDGTAHAGASVIAAPWRA